MNDKQWADETADKIRKRREEQQLKRKAFVAEEEIKKTQAPVLWEELKRELKNEVAILSSSLAEPNLIAISEKDGDHITLAATGVDVSAWFNRDRLSVEAVLVNTGRTYAVHVADGNAVFLVRDVGIKTPKQAARECLDSISNYL